MYFFISKVKISLQMSKFPGNQVSEFRIFSRHRICEADYLTGNLNVHSTTGATASWGRMGGGLKVGTGKCSPDRVPFPSLRFINDPFFI